MAFEVYSTRGDETSGRTPNYITLAVVGTKKLNLCLGIGPETMKERDWKMGDKIAVYFGTGEDLGKMLLRKDDEHGTVLALYGKKPKKGDPPGKIMKAIKPIKPIEKFVNTTISATKLKFQWDEGQQGFVAELPEGFFTE